MSMNVLLLPNGGDQAASASAEAQIQALGMKPVPLGTPMAIEAVVLVGGAEPFSYLAAGVFLGRNYPVAFYSPAAGCPDAEGLLMFHAGSPGQLRNWLDDLYTWPIEIGPREPKATKRRRGR